MKKFSFFLLLFFSMIVFLFFKTFHFQKKGDWLAKINRSVIRKEDFLREIKSLDSKKYKNLENPKIKRAVLDQMVEKSILLEEAQLFNLDKEKDFLFLVESFWKKLMIQNLLLKKAKEISHKTSINSKKIEEYSKRFDFKVHARIRIFSEKKVPLKLIKKELLSYEDQKLLIKDSGWNWFVYEEVISAYRKVLFNMDLNASKIFYHYNLGWIFLEVDLRKKRKFKSNLERQLIFVNVLKEDMDLNLIRDWMVRLKKKHHVIINQKFLNQIESVKNNGKE